MRIRFGHFVLDLGTRLLTGRGRAVHLTPKAFELLATLAAARPRAMSKRELQERLWPETFVAEANLSNLIAEIRDALGDRGRPPVWIRTAHGFGYAFCGEAQAEGQAAPPDPPLGWLAWGRRRFALPPGEHLIGRDENAAIRLDASTVSRRHARVVVTAVSVTLEDFGSKNGTRRGEDRVTGPVTLEDGDAVRIGSVLLTFHRSTALVSTETQVEPA